MKITYSWLKEYLDTTASVEEITTALTALGLEVEAVENKAAALKPFTVAHILEAVRHPDAERLQVCKVLTKNGERSIVCGAPNARAGLKVVLADIGVTIPNGGFVIKQSKIRGVESQGMLCSASELGLSEESEGIIELPQDAAIGESVVSVLGLDDVVITLNITPNRGDCLGVYGVARDMAAAGLGTLKPIRKTTIQSNASIKNINKEIILQSDKCKIFAGRLIKNVKNGESPEWLKQRLTSVGLRPISTLVDITNYFTIAYGRPLHVFDASKLGTQIVARDSREGETITALNGKDYTLPSGLCVIADEHKVLGIGGVIGGQESGCQLDTTDVMLECAWFEPAAIATSGRSLQIDSDARYRFERTVDPEFVLPAAELATQMIVELCGTESTLVGELVVAGSAPDFRRSIRFHPAAVAQLGGVKLDQDTCIKRLSALGFDLMQQDDALLLTTPSWRPDIESVPDVVEELLRLGGYDAIEEVLLPPVSRSALQVNPQEQRQRLVRRILASRGLLGVTHFAFIDRASAARFQSGGTLVEVINPISSELDTMRTSLIPALLRAFGRNQDRGFKQVNLFEVGAIFQGIGAAFQHTVAISVRAGISPASWIAPAQAATVFDAKADVLAVLGAMGMDVEKLRVTTDVPAWYHPGQAGRIGLGGKVTLAYFGALHPAILREYGIDQDVVVAEIFLDAVPQKRAKESYEALKVSDYQSATRDFAFLVDQALPAADLVAALRNADKQLLRDVTVFDVYAGKGVAEGKKSLAVSVTLQADDRTLTEDEIIKLSQALIQSAVKVGAVLR